MVEGAAPAEAAAWVALGANLGDPLAQLRGALGGLEELGRVAGRSSIYRTAPVGGPSDQPDYLNAVVRLEPAAAWREPEALLGALREIEARHGRERRVRWAARSLDLDLLALGDARRDTEALELPHPRMMERAFVLAPLCELEPAWRHPVTGEAACEALRRVGGGGVRRTSLAWQGDGQPRRGGAKG